MDRVEVYRIEIRSSIAAVPHSFILFRFFYYRNK